MHYHMDSSLLFLLICNLPLSTKKPDSYHLGSSYCLIPVPMSYSTRIVTPTPMDNNQLEHSASVYLLLPLAL